ncbi:hypothetical protein [Algoriphagus vanfongensis]|uniref:hypothetical protein n=1 Tax=Algoriphagus vanfongensis TaxID=426371 RepID=UPI0003F51CB5|nr:hypothetical protein [Algoriphagus vanfongensis]
MKIWKSLLVLISVFLLAAAGYWTYITYFSTSKVHNLELIGQDAVFVLESDESALIWNEIVEHSSWGILKNFPAFQRISDHLIALDSLTGNSGQVTKLFNGNTLTISYHPTGAETFDLLFTLEASQSTGEDLKEEISQKLPEGSRISSRLYSSMPITEIMDAANTRTWSFTSLGSVIVASQSSFLIEEAIRNYLNPELQSFADLIPTDPTLESGRGILWLSGKGLGSLLKGTHQNRESLAVESLQSLDALVGLQMFLDENQIRFEGNLHLADDVDFTPALSANLLEVEKTISTSTLAVTQFNLPSIYETQKLKNRAFPLKSTLQAEIQRNLTDRGFLDNFTGELYLIELDAYGGSDQNLALIARNTAADRSFAMLKNFLASQGNQTSDYYRDQEILFIGDEEFPGHIFEGKFFGFPQTYVTALDELLLFTNSQQAMKLVLDDYTNGNNWANENRAPSAKIALTPSAGFSRVYLIPEIWKTWTQNSNPSWTTFLQKYAAVFQAFPYVSFRINQIGEETKASLVFPFKAAEIEEIKPESTVSLNAESQVAFPNPLIYGPKAITNYQDNTEDLVIQDSNHILYLVNSAGETVYQQQLSGPVISEALQVDYYKNGKLQLLVATADRIYGIDRLGNPLPNYPFSFAGKTMTHLNLVDYDNNKEYRYFVSTADGELYLLDKTGERLEGWNPLKIGQKTIAAPAHYRVPGRGDYMVAIGENGKIFLFNRRGEVQSGSPIQVADALRSGFVFNRSSKSRTFQLSGISSEGEVIHLNFAGEISYRNQLIKEDRDNEFLVIPDQKDLDYLIISRHFNQVKVMDRDEKELFSARVSDGDLSYQYFDFGSNRQIVVITDRVQEFAYLYDLQGNLLTQLPPESKGEIEISYYPNQNKYLIRTIAGQHLTTYQLSD